MRDKDRGKGNRNTGGCDTPKMSKPSLNLLILDCCLSFSGNTRKKKHQNSTATLEVMDVSGTSELGQLQKCVCVCVCVFSEVVCVVLFSWCLKKQMTSPPLWTLLDLLCDQEWSKLQLQGVSVLTGIQLLSTFTYYNEFI